MSYDFTLTTVDTDALAIAKKDMSPFSEEENIKLLKELNSLFPELIVWEDDGYYESVLIVRAKNYALIEHGSDKVIIKGSGLKATTKEPALREMVKLMIESFLGISEDKIEDIYVRYVKEAYRIKDIQRWGAKKSVTEKMMKGDDLGARKKRAAIAGKGLDIGDKFFVYFTPDESLKMIEDFDGEYHVNKMLEKVYKTGFMFSTVLDMKELCPNYKLKKNKAALDKLVGNVIVKKKE